jgi:hypothetical protein
MEPPEKLEALHTESIWTPYGLHIDSIWSPSKMMEPPEKNWK